MRKEELITTFIHSIISDVDVIFEEDEFWVDIEEEVINIGVNPDPRGDKLIQEFVLDTFGIDMDPFLIGVLHEIFHIFTYDEQTMANDKILYALLAMDYEDIKYEEYSCIYFNLPSEFEATKGAVEYYLGNQDKCDNFIAELCR